MKTTTINHTPGPWVALNHGVATWNIEATTGRSPNVTVMGIDEPTAEADARLIAAAPEFLEALKYYASGEARDHGYDNGAFARAVIAKAEGARNGH